MWHRAWIDAVDHADAAAPEDYRLVQNEGTGLLIQGTREWRDYCVEARVTPHLVEACGLCARVQGLRRYYALLLCRGNRARLVKALDGATVLAESALTWDFGATYDLRLAVVGSSVRGWIDGTLLFDVRDTSRPLLDGAVALLCQEGRMAADAVAVGPAGPNP